MSRDPLLERDWKVAGSIGAAGGQVFGRNQGKSEWGAARKCSLSTRPKFFITEQVLGTIIQPLGEERRTGSRLQHRPTTAFTAIIATKSVGTLWTADANPFLAARPLDSFRALSTTPTTTVLSTSEFVSNTAWCAGAQTLNTGLCGHRELNLPVIHRAQTRSAAVGTCVLTALLILTGILAGNAGTIQALLACCTPRQWTHSLAWFVRAGRSRLAILE